MSAKPPAEHLPLAVRKNIRDEYEAQRPEFEQQLSKILGTPWTIDIKFNVIWPYADGGYAKEQTGSCVVDYVHGALSRLQEFAHKYGEEGQTEINTICSSHRLTMAFDEKNEVNYCGVDVQDGALRILFADGKLGTNSAYALEKLDKALNEAPARGSGDPGLNYTARTSIREHWDPEIGAVKRRLADQLKNPNIKLEPNWNANFAKMKGSQNSTDNWEENFGRFALMYFNALAGSLEYQKFGSDDLLQEGFAEAVDQGEVVLRVVDKLDQEYYNECLVEGGRLYLQTPPQYWGTNIDDIATKLIDQL